jgi:hypothetical protein
MKSLFDGALDTMEKANKQAIQIRNLIESVYKKFHTEHGLAKIKPAGFSLLSFRSEFQRLYEEGEKFRNSPMMMMTEQHFVVKKFFITLASRARVAFNDAQTGARAWSTAILSPILTQVREHKLMMEKRLENLKKIHDNHDARNDRVEEMQKEKQDLELQMQTIRELLKKLDQPIRLNS